MCTLINNLELCSTSDTNATSTSSCASPTDNTSVPKTNLDANIYKNPRVFPDLSICASGLIYV